MQRHLLSVRPETYFSFLFLLASSGPQSTLSPSLAFTPGARTTLSLRRISNLARPLPYYSRRDYLFVDPGATPSFSFSRISRNLSPLYSLFSNHSPLHSLFLCISFSHAHRRIHTPVHETLPRSSVLHLSLVFALLHPFCTIVLRACPFRFHDSAPTLVTLFLYLILFFLQHGHVQTLFLLVRRISNPAHPCDSLFSLFFSASPGTSPFSLLAWRVFRTLSNPSRFPPASVHPTGF